MRDSDGMELFESYLRDVKRSSQNTCLLYTSPSPRDS